MKPAQITEIKPKVPMNWMLTLKKIEQEHWRKLVVTIHIRQKIMAGKPVSLDVAKAMIKARGLEETIEAVNTEDPEAVANAVAQAKNEGKCEFHRRLGKPGCWFPTNHIKAGIKENWSALGYRVKFRGSRGSLAECMFVYSVPPKDTVWDSADREWILLADAPSGEETLISHTTGPSGPVSALKIHEYIIRPKITFEIAIAQEVMEAEKVPDEALAKTLYHFGAHGLGACRSAGFGTFDIINIEEVLPSPEKE
jgi:hypothetical protein